MSLKIKFYTDAGHGWGAVKREKLEELGLLKKITPYSYTKGKTVYLEEDCDLPTFVTALAVKGIRVEWKRIDHGDRSPIRSYPRFMDGDERYTKMFT